MRNLAKSLILVLLAFVLCSCTASLPTQRDVYAHLAGISELESHDLVRIEQTGKDDSGRTTQEVYTFVTKRGFEFAVIASIHGNYIDGSKFGESSYVSDTYVDAVHELYLPRIRAVLPEYDTEYNVAHDFDTEQIISQVLACDEIYREELSVHSAEWLSIFPVETIFFKYYPDYSDEFSGRFSVRSIKVDGSNTEEGLRSELSEIKRMPEIAKEEAIRLSQIVVELEGEAKQIPNIDIVDEIEALVLEKASTAKAISGNIDADSFKREGFFFSFEAENHEFGLLISQKYAIITVDGTPYKTDIKYKDFMDEYRYYIFDADDHFL